MRQAFRPPCDLLGALLALSMTVRAQPLVTPPTGDAAKGKVLFEQTYRCYACHGYTGETGSPRLVPMTRSEAAFIAYIRKPATTGMPPLADVPPANLADVYAYIRSLKPDAPAIEEVPLLRDLLRDVTRTR